MPFMKKDGKTVLALEPEVKVLEADGWKQLDEAEEAEYRRDLHHSPEATSAAAQDAARVDAGVFEALGGVESDQKAPAAQVSAAKVVEKKTAKKLASASKGKK